MANDTAVFQTKVVSIPTHEVVSQEGDVIWVKGDFWSGNRLATQHALVSIPPKPYQTTIDNNNFKVGYVGPVERIRSDAIEDKWDVGIPTITSSGSNYRTGEVVSLLSEDNGQALPNVNFTVTAVDENGGVTSVAPVDPKHLPVDLTGNYALSAPVSPEQTKTTTNEAGETSTTTTPSTAGSVQVNATKTPSTSTPTYIEATRIVLSDHQGPVVFSGYQGNNGVIWPGVTHTTFQNLVGKKVSLMGIGEYSKATFATPIPVYAD